MEGLDIDNEQEEMTLAQAQQIIQQQKERIQNLLLIEDRFRRLQKEYDRLKSEIAYSKLNQETRGVDNSSQEIRKLREKLQEKENRVQYLEEVDNRLVLRLRNLQAEISAKDRKIQEVTQEINFLNQSLDKPTQILVSEIQQKDMIIENLKNKVHQTRSKPISISELPFQYSSFSYGNIPSSLEQYSMSSSMSMQPSSMSATRSRRNNNRFQNREHWKNETDIMNKWNDTVQAYDEKDKSFIIQMKQYVILIVTRLSMLEKDFNQDTQAIYSTQCTTCSKPFSCFCKPRTCSICMNMFCKDCSPHTLPLGQNGKGLVVCNVCESMYRFVFRKEVTQ